MSRQILLRLSLIEFEHLKEALVGSKVEFEALEQQLNYYVTEMPDRIETALAILREHEGDE